MSKKALIARECKRQFLIAKYKKKRYELKKQIIKSSIQEEFTFKQKLQKLPRDSSYIRAHNRCSLSGRPKGFFRNFKLSRHFLREMALNGLLPGVKKASW
uniref:Small ribosomal subunit protein uS14c n=1 Tax=Callipsygma wilsonis TaxID=2320807 RepID=A0A386B002_9CHLO|nr:ribosomal protein S14 [Callipsygma wilsonis]AYC65025.1 ribosomal protein S14 [Callipsygma wilsonis]